MYPLRILLAVQLLLGESTPTPQVIRKVAVGKGTGAREGPEGLGGVLGRRKEGVFLYSQGQS